MPKMGLLSMIVFILHIFELSCSFSYWFPFFLSGAPSDKLQWGCCSNEGLLLVVRNSTVVMLSKEGEGI